MNLFDHNLQVPKTLVVNTFDPTNYRNKFIDFIGIQYNGAQPNLARPVGGILSGLFYNNKHIVLNGGTSRTTTSAGNFGPYRANGIFTSDDAVTYTARTLPGSANFIPGSLFLYNNLIYLFNDSEVLTSPNGEDWTSLTTFTSSQNNKMPTFFKGKIVMAFIGVNQAVNAQLSYFDLSNNTRSAITVPGTTGYPISLATDGNTLVYNAYQGSNGVSFYTEDLVNFTAVKFYVNNVEVATNRVIPMHIVWTGSFFITMCGDGFTQTNTSGGQSKVRRVSFFKSLDGKRFDYMNTFDSRDLSSNRASDMQRISQRYETIFIHDVTVLHNGLGFYNNGVLYFGANLVTQYFNGSSMVESTFGTVLFSRDDGESWAELPIETAVIDSVTMKIVGMYPTSKGINTYQVSSTGSYGIYANFIPDAKSLVMPY